MDYQNNLAIWGTRQIETHSRSGTVPRLKEMMDWRNCMLVRLSTNGIGFVMHCRATAMAFEVGPVNKLHAETRLT